MSTNVSPSDDIIDSRDLNATIDALNEELDDAGVQTGPDSDDYGRVVFLSDEENEERKDQDWREILWNTEVSRWL